VRSEFKESVGGCDPHIRVREITVSFRSIVSAAALLLAGFLSVEGSAAQVRGSVSGEVLDAESGLGVADAVVVLVGLDRSALTDSAGAFQITGVPSGGYGLRVVHLAYGEFQQPIEIMEGEAVILRIRLSQTAIELEPLVVEAVSEEEFQARSRGTRRNVITREEIASLQDTGGHVGHILARHIPGIRLRSDQNRSGEPICLEFRSPVSLQDPLACKPPVVLLDGVRVSSPNLILTTLPTENIQRMEVIPPGEAGVAYGTDSRYGVLLIETRRAADILGEVGGEPRLRRGLRYEWAAEPEPYRWKRVFGLSLLGTAAGVVAGYAIGSRCLEFDGLSDHFLDSECGSWATAGTRLAVLTLPQLGASLAARYAGGTDLSRGKLGYHLVAASFVAAPGLLLSLTSSDDGFTGSSVLGNLLLGLGVPMAATFADRMFRKVRIEFR
jgi:hypothetical protein